MDVLTAVGVAQLPIHKSNAVCERRAEARKPFCFNPFNPQQLLLQPSTLSKSSKLGYLGAAATAFYKSTFDDGIARALTYEEALEQSIDYSSYGAFSVDFDIGSVIDNIFNFSSENPIVIAGGFSALAIPLVLILVLGKNKSWGVESAKRAYAKLGEEGDAQLLDIRGSKDIKEVGSPDIKGLKKRVISIAYGGDNQAFLKKLSAKFKDPGNTTLFILDKVDGNSGKVAELVASNGFKAGFAIKDGVRGWMNSGLPWLQPKKGFKLDFSDLSEAVNDALGEGGDLLPSTLGLAAATGLGVLAFSEIETVLQLLGSAAVIQFTISKLLFAEDRKVTLRQINEFLNTKVAPKELSDEIKLIGKAFLPIKVETDVETVASKEVESEITVAIAEERPEVEAKISVTETLVDPTPNSERISTTLPQIQRALSPYPYYPDFKPPTSPSPSKP